GELFSKPTPFQLHFGITAQTFFAQRVTAMLHAIRFAGQSLPLAFQFFFALTLNSLLMQPLPPPSPFQAAAQLDEPGAIVVRRFLCLRCRRSLFFPVGEQAFAVFLDLRPLAAQSCPCRADLLLKSRELVAFGFEMLRELHFLPCQRRRSLGELDFFLGQSCLL